MGILDERTAWHRIESIVDRVLDLADSDRERAIEAECAGNTALAQAVRQVLRTSISLFDTPVAGYGAGLPDQGFVAGTRVGPFRIESRLGEGGMGVVYRASRADDQFEQDVALKLLRPDLGWSDEARRRFLDERQMLASLDHPHIARLHDGGVTPEGMAYFAMEYVAGVPVDEWCNARRLDLHARLRLFLKICDAVQAAHQRLIIHRDIKPSNVLVTETGQPKLLDFGVAKLQDGDVDRTRTGFRPLTPGYASPEQWQGGAVSTASDVYSLGVMLYELLSGRRPHQLTGRPEIEWARIVAEETPRPPSAVIDDSAAQERGGTLARLRRQLAGDLDTIVLAALQADVTRRYPTVDRLAADIGRYLDRLPVSARPDTFFYRTAKFVRRHRAAVAGSVMAVVSLVAGLAATAWQARRAEQEALRANAAKGFLAGIFNEAAPDRARGDTLSARALLDRAAARIDTAFADQPAIRFDLYSTLGTVYRDLALFPQAATMYERAIAIATTTGGADSAWRGRFSLAIVRLDEGRLATAESLLVAARLAAADRGTTRDRAEVLSVQAEVHRRQYRFQEAEAELREAIAISGSDADARTLARFWNNLSVVLSDAGGRLAGTDSALTVAWEYQRRVLPPGHPELLLTMNNLADVKASRWQLDSAIVLQREVLARQRRNYPDGHERVAMALNNLAWSEMVVGDYPAAEAGFREATTVMERQYGTTTLNSLISMNNVGRVLILAGRHAEAAEPVTKVLALARKALGPDHGFISAPLYLQGQIALAEGDSARALSIWTAALDHANRHLPAAHGRVADLKLAVGQLIGAMGRRDEAERLIREGLISRRTNLAADDPDIGSAAVALADQLARRGKWPESDALFSEGLKRLAATPYRAKEAAAAMARVSFWKARRPAGQARE